MRWRITISLGMPMPLQRLVLERVDVEALAVGQRVQLHVDDRRRQVFDGLEALVEVARRLASA